MAEETRVHSITLAKEVNTFKIEGKLSGSTGKSYKK